MGIDLCQQTSEYFIKVLQFLLSCIILCLIMQIKLFVIIPQPLNVSGMKQELINMMRDVGERIREEFEDTTKTWNHKPRFEPSTSVPKVGTDMISVETTTTDKVYNWVSDGTPSHPIFPVNAKALAFPGKFIPKTFPGIIGSGVGSSGPVDQFRNWVAHPGVEARKFDKSIADKEKENIKISLKQTMSLVAKASKHKFP